MRRTSTDHRAADANTFAALVRRTSLSNAEVRFGHFVLAGRRGVDSRIQYNEAGLDLLRNQHAYTFRIRDGELQVSLQLYENVSNHYRLFCFTRVGEKQGMTFSVNLTTEKESERAIFLAQKVKFAERFSGDAAVARAIRQRKQLVLASLLRGLGLDVTENNDLVLGIFDPSRRRLVNTSPEKFLNDFLVVSLLKGHYQGNKGYQLEIVPAVNEPAPKLAPVQPGRLGHKLAENQSRRDVPLGLRYLILVRDGSRCQRCGQSAVDGARLHVDHKTPHSLGGHTVAENLWTLCIDCNLGKGNRHVDP